MARRVLLIDGELQFGCFAPPAAIINLGHDEEIEPAIVVEVGRDDVTDLVWEGDVD